ncbi:MAG: hypothetical protein ACC651_15080 [Candidatus Scalindua sp.]
MLKRPSKFIALLLAAVGIILLNILIAGVSLKIENKTETTISNIAIKHAGGVTKFDKISANSSEWEYLGKIGEGSSFRINWKDKNGRSRGAEFEVYFISFGTITDINIIIRNDSILLLEEGNINKPGNTW